MADLIAVCGLGRSGTNSVSTYLHLNHDIVMYRGGLPMGELIDFQEWNNPSDLQILSGEPETDKAWFLDGWIKCKNYMYMAHLVENVRKMPYIGRRTESIESYVDLISDLTTRFDVKFIYCMRKDSAALYASRLSTGWTHDYDEFKRILIQSWTAAQKLKIDGHNICAVDITVEDPSEDLKRIDRFLGVLPSSHQLWWQRENPLTNKRAPDSKYYKKVIELNKDDDILFKEIYQETRSIIND